MRGGGLAFAVAVAALAAGCLATPGAASGDGDPDSDAGDTAGDAGGDELLDGLVAWYKMDEGGDTGIAPDAIAGNDGICTAPACPQLVTGHIGGAYQYDGDDDEVLVADRAAFHTDSGTAAVWIYPTGGGTMILSKPFGGETSDSWLLYADSDGSVLFETTAGRYISATGLVSLDTWTHLAMTWSPAGNQLYIDGVPVKSGGSGTTFDGSDVVLGADHDYGDQILPMQGLLDDVRIYDRVLSATEIGELAAM